MIFKSWKISWSMWWDVFLLFHFFHGIFFLKVEEENLSTKNNKGRLGIRSTHKKDHEMRDGDHLIICLNLFSNFKHKSSIFLFIFYIVIKQSLKCWSNILTEKHELGNWFISHLISNHLRALGKFVLLTKERKLFLKLVFHVLLLVIN